MAAAIQILSDSTRETVVKLTNDGTTETAALKVTAATLLGALAVPLNELVISEATWSVSNDATVALLWGATTNVTCIELSGSSSLKVTGSENFQLKNNGGAGVNGDILLTTRNWGATKSYTVILKLTKRAGYDRGGDPTVSV